MKKSIYLLIIIFLVYGKGFAGSLDFCKKPSPRCLDCVFVENSENIEHRYCTKHFLFDGEIKTIGLTTIYYISIDTFKTANYTASKEFDSKNIDPIIVKYKRLSHLKLEDYFSEPMNPAYFKGFGIRLKI